VAAPRSLAVLVALTALAIPALGSSPGGAHPDPRGDQGSDLQCHDPRSDVVVSSVDLDADSLDIALTMDDLAGTPACGPVPLAADGHEGFLHVYMNYTCDPDCRSATGHYLFFQHDLEGSLCVMVYSPLHGSSSGCTSLGGPVSVSGDTLSWSIPRSGAYSDRSATRSYAFDGPVCYYGYLYAEMPTAAGPLHLHDRYAWNDQSLC
jgi:hypothetical protein